MSKSLFISYSHDSEAHATKVLQLANFLRQQGYKVLIDQHMNDPEQGWPLWMENGIADADMVLLIFTATYTRRILGKEAEGIGYGCRFEGQLIYNAIYNCENRNARFLPILFDEADKRHVPNLLSGNNYFYLDAQDQATFDNLKRRIDGNHRAKAAELGEHKKLADLPDPGNFFQASSTTATAQKPAQNQKIDTTAMPITPIEIVGREKELKLLDEAWDDHGCSIISFIAWGGVGKSSLIGCWLDGMRQKQYGNALRVFAHSFYSQGTSDQRQVSAEHFIEQAYGFLQFNGERPTGSHETGLHLAQLFCAQRTLLILDGLEPMQHPPGVLQGKLKDAALSALLKSLESNLKGLCVITSRVAVLELRTKPITLENLSVEAGVNLLNSFDITGPDKQKQQVVGEVFGHALTLSLLGSFLQVVHNGDIFKRDTIKQLTDEEKQGEHANHVMAAYEGWLGTSDKPDLTILYIISLFDRPADWLAVESLLKGAKNHKKLKKLLEPIKNLNDTQWQYALNRLNQLKLINSKDKTQLDCHPLVREYFANAFKTQHEASYLAAHECLYHYYKSVPTMELPETLAQMEPLFSAISHGCKAQCYQQALDDVYWSRILRKEAAYINRQLGAFGSDLACLSHFFEQCWHTPAVDLNEGDQAALLNWSGFALRGLGRLQEAVMPFEAGFERQKLQQNWLGAATNAINSSELYLSLGDITNANKWGKLAVEYADKAQDDFLTSSLRANYAYGLLQGLPFSALTIASIDVHNRLTKINQLFEKAEEIKGQSRPDSPHLVSMAGFQYQSFLLTSIVNNVAGASTIDSDAKNKVIDTSLQQTQLTVLSDASKSKELRELLIRVEKALEVALQEGWGLYIALSLLLRAQIHSFSASLNSSQSLSQYQSAIADFDQAVSGLRAAGGIDDLPLGLLARAQFYTGLLVLNDVNTYNNTSTINPQQPHTNHKKAWQDLDELYDIAYYSEMKLHLTDYHIIVCNSIIKQLANDESVIIFQEQGQEHTLNKQKDWDDIIQKYQSHKQEVTELIERTGYHLRDGDLAKLPDSLKAKT